MKAKDAVIGWEMKSGGRVVVAPLGTNLPPEFATTGGVWRWLHETRSGSKVQAFVLAEALHMIIRDGLDPKVVHEALLAVDEYRAACADDMPKVAKLREKFGEN